MTDIRMTDVVELIQGLKYQLKGTRRNNTVGRKEEGNSETLVENGRSARRTLGGSS